MEAAAGLSSQKESNVNALVRAIAWPVVSLLVIGAPHLVAEGIRPELHDVVAPAVAMPIYLVVGGWAAFAVVRGGATFVHGLVAGALIGLMPALLQFIGFGLILGRDATSVATAALFGFIAVFWGSSLGAGLASSALAVARSEESKASARPDAQASGARAS